VVVFLVLRRKGGHGGFEGEEMSMHSTRELDSIEEAPGKSASRASSKVSEHLSSKVELTKPESEPSQLMDNEHLTQFVRKELTTGKSKDDIIANLERLGYNVKDVEKLFDKNLHDVIPAKYEKQMREFVMYNLDNGKSSDEIRKLLKKQGWSDAVIDRFLVG
jgi:SOS response regulatory protein OraA/RecX